MSGSTNQVSSLAQQLPISAYTVIDETRIELEVATTPRQQAIGLMFRTELADDRGMLFPFSPPRPVNFWMRNVEIPLDMVFIRDRQVIAIAHAVPPCRTEQCPTYGPAMPVDAVLELRGGRAAELDLEVGDPLVVTFVAPESTGQNSREKRSPSSSAILVSRLIAPGSSGQVEAL